MENETVTEKPKSIVERLYERKRPLNVHELADILSVSERTIYERALKGSIPSFRVGTIVRFDPVAVARWLDGVPTGPVHGRRTFRRR